MARNNVNINLNVDNAPQKPYNTLNSDMKHKRRKEQSTDHKRREPALDTDDDWYISSDDEDTHSFKHNNSSNHDDPFVSDDEEPLSIQIKPVIKQKKPMKPMEKETEMKVEKSRLRSPICCVLGHVDTGKTAILDSIRNSDICSKESGFITQQIGATYVSIDYIKDKTRRLKECINSQKKLKYKVPGLLFIDTPGHESFVNLRERGSSLCDIAILVVDIMNGLQMNTVESLKILSQRKVPYIVALNKIDTCYGWKSNENMPFVATYKQQAKCAKNHFEKQLQKVKVQFAHHSINAKIYSKNKRMDRDVSLVPVSAKSGEGIADLLYLMVQLTKRYLSKRLVLSCTLKASVLEVKKCKGYGTVIDVIISDGTLRKNDTIVVCGLNGAIVTHIRQLLLPSNAQEMRDKCDYQRVDDITAAGAVRIVATHSLRDAVAGSPILVVPRRLQHTKYIQKRNDTIRCLKSKVEKCLNDFYKNINKTGNGVCVYASTLGSLEALIMFLRSHKISVSDIGIGCVSKESIIKASNLKKNEYKVFLAFNVDVSVEIKEYAKEKGVTIFASDMIYHLEQKFEKYIEKPINPLIKKEDAIFPVEFNVSPQHIFNNKNPLIFGVKITRGTLYLKTPICAKTEKGALYLGSVYSIRCNDKEVDRATVGDNVSVCIKGEEEQCNIQIGRTFRICDVLVSRITRKSIDALKIYFEDEIKCDHDVIAHIQRLKKYFGICDVQHKHRKDRKRRRKIMKTSASKPSLNTMDDDWYISSDDEEQNDGDKKNDE